MYRVVPSIRQYVEKKGAEVEGGAGPTSAPDAAKGDFRGGTSLGSIYLMMIVPIILGESMMEVRLT
jgi:hypothetical protein